MKLDLDEATRLWLATTREYDDWEVGGPYPGTSVIVCVAPGCSGPDPEEPVYAPIAVLDQRTKGEPSERARANAAFMVYAHTHWNSAVKELNQLRIACQLALNYHTNGAPTLETIYGEVDEECLIRKLKTALGVR